MRYQPQTRLLLDHACVRIGEFHCPPQDTAWNKENMNDDGCLIVFPHRAVGICQAGSEPVVADANHVMFYNLHQVYERSLIDELGDHCTWIALSPTDLCDLIRPFDPSVDDRAEFPFSFDHGFSDSIAFAAHRMIVSHLFTAKPLDDLLIQETCMRVAHRTICASFAMRRTPADVKPSTRKAHMEAVRAAEGFLATNFDKPVSLDDVARHAHLSMPHLCRVFRKNTGVTIHAYLNRLRLRAGLEAIAQGSDNLLRLALDIGYSSHSHFSDAFKREYGICPSEARSALRTGQMSKILIAQSSSAA